MNKLNNLHRFLSNWQEPSHNTIAVGELKTSESGNINITGSVQNGSASYTLTAAHPQFYEYIEPGVRDLVRTLIEKYNYITYSSCEGHASMPGQTDFEPRHVGLIPRDYEQYCEMHRLLIYLSSTVNQQICKPGMPGNIYLVTRIEPIETDDGPDVYGLDLYFYKFDDDEAAYFNGIAYATNLLTNLLRQQ